MPYLIIIANGNVKNFVEIPPSRASASQFVGMCVLSSYTLYVSDMHWGGGGVG